MYLLGVIGIILSGVITLVSWMIIIQALLSFVNPDKNNPIIQFLDNNTYPVYNFVRQKAPFPTSYNNINFTPLIILLLLKVVDLAVAIPLTRFYTF